MDEYTSIIIVSHSEKVAQGIQELIAQIAGNIVVEVAGGTDTGEIGTSVKKITRAIERAESPKGTLLFYDIGSAKMNAEFTLEMKEYDDVNIIDAPLVEGAYVAAVKASIGKSAEEIKQNLQALFPKMN